MAGAPSPRPAVFRLSRDKPMKRLLLGLVALVGAMLWLLIEHGWRGFFLMLGVSLMIFAFWRWTASRDQEAAETDRAPKLIVDAEGIAIPDLFRGPVPWTAIDRLTMYRGRRGDYLALAMDAPEQHGYAPDAGDSFRRMFGDRSVQFDYSPLDCDKAKLVAALKRHAPPRLTDGL